MIEEDGRFPKVLDRAFNADVPNEAAETRIRAVLRSQTALPAPARRPLVTLLAARNLLAGVAVFVALSAALSVGLFLKFQDNRSPLPHAATSSPATTSLVVPATASASPAPSAPSPTLVPATSPAITGFVTVSFVLHLSGPVAPGDSFGIYFPRGSQTGFDFCNPIGPACVSGQTYTRAFTDHASTTTRPYRFEKDDASGHVQVIAQGDISFASDSTIRATYR